MSREWVAECRYELSFAETAHTTSLSGEFGFCSTKIMTDKSIVSNRKYLYTMLTSPCTDVTVGHRDQLHHLS